MIQNLYTITAKFSRHVFESKSARHGRNLDKTKYTFVVSLVKYFLGG
jgi:ribosomal protein L35